VRILINVRNASEQRTFNPTTGGTELYHSAQANDVDCNAAEGSSEGWLAEHYADHIARFTPGSGSGSTDVVSTSYAYPKHLAVYNGEIVVASRNDGQIHRYSFSGSHLGSFSTGYTNTQGVATDGSSIFVSVWNGGSAYFQEYSSSFTLLGTHSMPSGLSGNNVFDMVYDQTIGQWYGLDRSGEPSTGTGTGRIVRFEMDGSVLASYSLSYDIDGIGLLACD
jgi:hypothetical protein